MGGFDHIPYTGSVTVTALDGVFARWVGLKAPSFLDGPRLMPLMTFLQGGRGRPSPLESFNCDGTGKHFVVSAYDEYVYLF